MKCYITGAECSCGAFDVSAACPHDTFANHPMEHDDDVLGGVFDLDDVIVERQFAAMADRLDGD